MIMPLVVTIIVILVSNNLARAFSLAGVFTLVRFRLAMNDSSDLAYILASVGTGLSAALGYLSLGLMITTFLAVVLFVLSTFLFKSNDRFAKLIVTMPEHLNLKDKLNKTIEKNTQNHLKLKNLEHLTLVRYIKLLID